MDATDWLAVAAAAARVLRAAPELVDAVKRFVDEVSNHKPPPPAVGKIIAEHVNEAEGNRE